MTNYERKKNMTIEEVAAENIQGEQDSRRGMVFFTSDGHQYIKYDNAFQHELDWLNQEAEESI